MPEFSSWHRVLLCLDCKSLGRSCWHLKCFSFLLKGTLEEKVEKAKINSISSAAEEETDTTPSREKRVVKRAAGSDLQKQCSPSPSNGNGHLSSSICLLQNNLTLPKYSHCHSNDSTSPDSLEGLKSGSG